MDQDRATESFISAPPSEPDISLPGFHLERMRITFDDDLLTLDTTMAALFATVLEGVGRVEVDSIHLRYSASQAGLTICAGLVNARSNATAKQVGMTRGNISTTSNAMNTGVLHERELSIPGCFSRQIQPTSSLLPDFKFVLSRDAGLRVHVEFVLRIYGERMQNLMLSELLGSASTE